ncbi:MAG: carboxypeptidase-like regulatory domain-containing protein [Bacteroidales bacterium]|nr:carboxypeptidase-like regulatory domain-containing protein [Bacteroidales bacterium]
MNTPLKIMLCLAICVGFVFSANAQKIHVAGKVTATNGTGIAGVHIFDSIAKIGTTSDINGIFNLTISPKTTKLRFSHIAFNTQYITLTKTMLSDTIAANTIWLDVVLTQKIMELPLLEISDAKVEIAYKNSKQWILDYEPVGANEFLLLLIEKNKRYLQLINSNHEKISQIEVSKDYKELIKDCFGTFHLISRDSACQIFLLDEELTLPYRYTRDDFDRIMAPIVVNTENYLYAKDFAGHRQVVLYDKINKETNELTIFIENSEEKRAITYRNNYVSKITNVFIGCNKKSGIDVTPEMIANFQRILINSKNVDELFRLKWMLYPADICRDVHEGIQFYKHVLSKPPYSLLTIINDTLYFFDHLNSLIVAYDLDGNYLRETPCNYHNNKGWDKEIIVNEGKTRCFAKFTRNGETSLVEINPNTGQMLGRYVLEVHAFPTKIKVRGNDIYYLSKDYFEREQKYFLWRQKME